MSRGVEALRNAKRALREVYAWPGGYPLHLVMSDGEAMSLESAREHWGQICRSTLGGNCTGWEVAGAAINWEDSDLVCCHSGKPIESAYGESA